MSSLEEKIKVMQAALDGVPIQYRLKNIEAWTTDQPMSVGWDWCHYDYRIAPRRFWIDKEWHAYYVKPDCDCIEVEEVL